MRAFKASLTLLMIIAVGLVMADTTQAQQDQTRFVLKLDDPLIANFKKYGSLKSQIPENFQSKINYIELQHSGSKDETPIESPTATSVSGNTATITLDDAMLGSVMKQPVRIKVDGQAFSEILLNYTGMASGNSSGTNRTEAAMQDGAKPGFATADMFFIAMSNGEKMSGSIEGFDTFKMETAFGEVSIPAELIAGVRFHIDGDDSAVVVLNNGDAVTGVPTIDAVSVATDWGTAEVEPRFIDSMTTAQNSSFSQNNTPFGSRWQLNSTNPAGTTTAPGNRNLLTPRR